MANYIDVKFINKKFQFPRDIITYIDLLEFTDNIHQELFGEFVNKINHEISNGNIGVLDDKDLFPIIEQQAGKYISKLCENGIFNRTITDYIKDNKGYQLYSNVNAAALEKMKSLLIREMEEWQTGYDNAVNDANSQITGMGFSLYSSSFINQAIYAAMEASTLQEHSKKAQKSYQNKMKELHSRLDTKYDKQRGTYIYNTYIPDMQVAIKVFVYELLDRYLADLIQYNKFDDKTLSFVDIGRSNDLLKNLSLSNNKKAIIENAFIVCPYNVNVFVEAMNNGFLDRSSFQTARLFKIDSQLLSLLKENFGEIVYPSTFNINYHNISLYATYTDTNQVDILHSLTVSYAHGIENAYLRISKILLNDGPRLVVIRSYEEEVLRKDDSICKEEASKQIESIVDPTTWEIITEKCGHVDLLSHIREIFSLDEQDYQTKEDLDAYLIHELSAAFSTTRAKYLQEVDEKRLHEERLIKEQAARDAEKKERRDIFIRSTVKKCVLFLTCTVVIFLLIGIVKLIKGKPIDSDFNDKYQDSLNGLIYNVPENWIYSGDYSDDNESWYVRAGDSDDVLGMMAVSYIGEDPDVTVDEIVQNVLQESSATYSKRKTINNQEFDIITFDFDDTSQLKSNVYITEKNGSVFGVTFIFEEEVDSPRLYKKIISKMSFEEYVNPKESSYQESKQLIEEGKYDEAYDLLSSLGKYKDTEELLEKCFLESVDVVVSRLIEDKKYMEAYKLLKSKRDERALLNFKVVYTHSEFENEFYHSVTEYSYDEYGNLLKSIETYEDGDTKIKEYEYDNNNHVIKKTITDSDVMETTYEYDTEGRLETETYEYNGVTHTKTYSYDEYGNMIRTVSKDSDEYGSRVKEYEYNRNGQLTKEIYEDGTFDYYEYGENDELIKAGYIFSDGKDLYTDYEYDDNGLLIREVRWNGDYSDYVYDSNDCLIGKYEYEDEELVHTTTYRGYVVYYLFDK